MRDALLARGADVAWPCWDDPDVDWASFDVTVIRSIWDYTWRREEFLRWVGRVDALSDLHNPAEVVRWNTHKAYLRDLEAAGVPVVPTAWLAPGEPSAVVDLAAAHGWRQAVVKPAVSAGARDTLRFALDDRAETAAAQEIADRLQPTQELMLQPFMQSVRTTGERSLLFIDGELTHAVRRPPYLDTGLYAESEHAEPAADEIAVADAVLAAVDATLLYARVDLVRDDDGAPLLAEVELIEPQLFLRLSVAATGRLSDAVLRLAGAAGSVGRGSSTGS